ncbi:hypothetical protein [Olsenella urininfantis]|uniref:hypothetical protein n=1 Tax=Olsenella urininfantis TaxID=1871033 RepID=UPI000985017F|nr:hypothetical protein [Olsenella urininfantis]
MSLRETIEAAKREAQEAGSIPSRGKSEGTRPAPEQPTTERGGFSRRSVTRARPAREAASGVRVVRGGSGQVAAGKSEGEMTKAERKASRQERRDREDRRAAASRVIIQGNEAYRRKQRIFWGLMIAGLGVTLFSWGITFLHPESTTRFDTPAGMAVAATIVLAYALIISAFVYDWRVIRPMRKEAERVVAGMTDKKVHQVLKADAEQLAREQEARAKAKESRRAKRQGK